ncbi:3737_t:CDS:2 [Scutellospora calospora]|uniref:3737_t:CDS:1 n=1 Tax=Scutellospora calospora TaxID=85575 RepID=A0ACA9K194_9GLOM|nr:3737_t:CDS:2 [Scutellospora calospora]
MSFIFSSLRDTLYSVTSCCFPNPTLQINRRTFKDASTGRFFALKQIRCPFGDDSVKDAMREVDMYRLFQHENIIKVINGNLQDAINNHSLQGSHFPEKDMLKIFRGICYAVRALHNYKLPNVRTEYNNIVGTQPPIEDNIVPFAHRDIKPGNILLDDDQTPILMDFGSLVRARIKVDNRSKALTEQDLAAENSTISYRAPELFDVKTNIELNEKVDIWSLGCTLYAMAYGKSPFENNINEHGGSIALAVLNNQFKFPTIENDRIVIRVINPFSPGYLISKRR